MMGREGDDRGKLADECVQDMWTCCMVIIGELLDTFVRLEDEGVRGDIIASSMLFQDLEEMLIVFAGDGWVMGDG